MPPLPLAPKVRAPQGACDTHAHMLAGPDDFPLWDGRVENPAQGIDFEGWLDLYKDNLSALGCMRGVIVHSIFYGSDNSVTAEAVRRLGPNFRGIGLLCDGAGASEVEQFVDWNMAGVRLNYVHGVGLVQKLWHRRWLPMGCISRCSCTCIFILTKSLRISQLCKCRFVLIT